VILDVASEVRAALAAAGLDGPALDERIERAVERVLSRREEGALLPLDKILGCTARAAQARLARDPDLRALGHRLGRRTLFRPAEVRAHLAWRQRDRMGVAG